MTVMNKYDIGDEQARFLEEYLDFIQIHYPPRYLAGVRKYKTTLTEDYTAEELVDNAVEEIMDNLAYTLAAKHQIAKLRARISELEDENARLKRFDR